MSRLSTHTLRAGVASAALLVSIAAHAQGGARPDAEVLADLKACGTLERDGARLACFDGVLADAGSSAASAGRAPARDGAADSGAATRVARAESAASEPRAAVPAAAQRPETERRGSAPDSQDGDDGEQTVTIVEINALRSGDASFVTATGEVYVQTSGRMSPGGYPDLPFETKLQDGALGSQFLYLGERRRVRVKIRE